MRTVKFYTFGCKINQYDTQAIREQFIRSGFKEINNGVRADICVINTCTVTQKADRESLYSIRQAQRKNPQAKIIVTGCFAEMDNKEILKQADNIVIARNKDKSRILELINENNEPNDTNDINTAGITSFSGHSRAFLKIQDGCDNFCSYCKVPLVRGKPRSKPIDQILKEAERLVGNGFKEIVLCGICLGAYGKDLGPIPGLEEVVEAIEGIPGLARIRLSSIEAIDITAKLINKISGSKKLCPHLHIPLQSGDGIMLKRMNRKYTPKEYINLIRKIKRAIPGISITTDVIVGFPGESEKSFGNTVGLIKRVVPLRTHIFPYSERKGTSAFGFEDKVSPEVVKERIARLKRVADSCALAYRKQFLGRNAAVLIEGRAKEDKRYWCGYTNNYLRVRLKADDKGLKNQLVAVKLKEINRDYIEAEI